MKLKEIMKAVESSAEFKAWRKKNAKCFLSGLFAMKDEVELSGWTVTYYDSKKDKMVSFELGPNVSQKPESEVMHSSEKIRELVIADVKIEPDAAVQKAESFCDEKYPNDIPLKTIVILQNVDAGLLWNLIFITRNFNTINIKVDARTRKVMEHKLTPIFDFAKGSL